MTYEYITKHTSPNQSPRQLRITGITIHWWDDPSKRPQFTGVVGWLCSPASGVSAHYVVEAGRVACIVDCSKAAWHAGSYTGNHSTIGIECNPRMSAGDLETVAQLVADLRKTYGNLPLFPHSHWVGTSCPGTYAGKLAWIDQRARQLSGGKAVTAPAAAPVPAQLVAVDGWWGPATTRALQRINATPVDGVVSGQLASMRGYLPAAASGWEWGNGAGSQLIKAMQTAFKVTPDGVMGPASVRGMQRYYKVAVDSIMGPATVRAMQRAINRQLAR